MPHDCVVIAGKLELEAASSRDEASRAALQQAQSELAAAVQRADRLDGELSTVQADLGGRVESMTDRLAAAEATAARCSGLEEAMDSMRAEHREALQVSRPHIVVTALIWQCTPPTVVAVA